MPSPTFRSPEDHPKGWGKESWLADHERYCGKLLTFRSGARFSAHFHDLKDETFYVLSGRIRFIYNDLANANQHEVIMVPGQIVDIPRLCVHQVEALEDSVVIEVSSPHFESDSYRVRKGDSQVAKSAERAAPATPSNPPKDWYPPIYLPAKTPIRWSNLIFNAQDEVISTGVVYEVTDDMLAAHPRRATHWDQEVRL